MNVMSKLGLDAAARHGFDPDRLGRIAPFLQSRYLDTGKLHNAQLLVARDEAPVYTATLGVAREDGAPLAEDALFRIASMTKPVTSVAFMMLLEEGAVALDTPVHHVLPELKGVAVYDGGGAGEPFRTRPTAAPMRMVDLLRHTAGLTYHIQQDGPVDAAYRERRIDPFNRAMDSDGFVAALAGVPLLFSPGEAWNYSVATDVLGAVVERLSGLSLGEFFRQRIFDPLGMVDSFFTVPADKAHRLGDCWMIHEDRGVQLMEHGHTSAWLRPRTFQSGGGGLVSTTRDYDRFCRMLLRGGELDGTRILSPKTLWLMTRNHLPGGQTLTQMSRSMFSEAQNAGVGFGLGFAVNEEVVPSMNLGTVGEYYWGGMYSTAFFVDPVERLTMVFMTQLMPSSAYPIRRELKALIYAAMTESRVG